SAMPPNEVPGDQPPVPPATPAASPPPVSAPPAVPAQPAPAPAPVPGEPIRQGPSSLLAPGQLVAGQARRMTPEQVRTTTFSRSPLSRRGIHEEEVASFVHRVADELANRETEINRLLDENHRLKQAMRDWQTERIDQPGMDVAER